MRRKVLMIAAAAAAGILLLTACTSSENTAMKEAGAGASGGTTSGTASQNSGLEEQKSDTGEQDGAGTADDQPGGTQSGQEVTGTPVDSGTSGSNTTAGGDDTQGSAASAAGEDPADGSASEDIVPGEFDGVYQAGAGEDESEPETGDIWTGTYGNEDETLTITYVDSKTISFSFDQSGIYGKAEVKGYQAVYKGDDYHVVVFNIHNDIVDVSVSSEEDYDTSGSPLIGTYIKDYVKDTGEDSTEADLNE